MKYLLTLCLSLTCYSLFAQLDEKYTEVTPAVIAKLNLEVDKEIPAFKLSLAKYKLEAFEMEFAVDTFKIEYLTNKRLILNHYERMADAYWAESELYDKLLNKYYKVLMAALKPEDRPILVQAQRAWIAYRDSELKLTELMSHIEFDAGTMQWDVNSGIYTDMIRKRVQSLVGDYELIKNEGQNYVVPKGK